LQIKKKNSAKHTNILAMAHYKSIINVG